MQTVLVVDDEPKIAQLARDYLEHAGFAVLHGGRRAVGGARRARPAAGPRRARPRPARASTVSRSCAAIRAAGPTPIVVADGARHGARQAARPGARRRRLRHQAVQPARARRPGPGRAPARRARRRAPRPPRAVGDLVARRAPPADDGRRATDRAHADRVLDPRDDGPRARPGLHAVAAARRGPRRRVRVLRAGDRRARQEHPPQARARPEPAALPPHGLRRRLPRRRGRRPTPTRGGPDRAARTPRPPWWPEDEPWPPKRWECSTGGSTATGTRRPAPATAPARTPARHPRTDAAARALGRPRAMGRPELGFRPARDMRRGFGCLIALMSTLVVSVGVLVLWLLAGLLGFARSRARLPTSRARPA